MVHSFSEKSPFLRSYFLNKLSRFIYGIRTKITFSTHYLYAGTGFPCYIKVFDGGPDGASNP